MLRPPVIKGLLGTLSPRAPSDTAGAVGQGCGAFHITSCWDELWFVFPLIFIRGINNIYYKIYLLGSKLLTRSS